MQHPWRLDSIVLCFLFAEAFSPNGLSQTITEHPIPAGSAAYGITTGPDGALWFTESGSNQIGRMTTGGALTQYAVPQVSYGGGGLNDITRGPDSGLWFGEVANVGRIGTDGTFAQYSTDPGPQGISITTGPDGALWFGEPAAWRIGRITTPGACTSPYGQTDASFNGITAGPDGALWIAVGGAPPDLTTIRRILPDGTLTAEYTSSLTPQYITTGPDGALWFTEYGSSGTAIGRISTSGQLTEYSLPTPGSQPSHIVAGPDGALWFTEYAASKIGRITTGGAITEYFIPGAANPAECSGSTTGPKGIAVGPDGAIWFTESCADSIGRLQLAGAATTTGSSSTDPPADAVVNAASFQTGAGGPAAVAPGAIVAIFGNNLAQGTGNANSLPLPSTLAGALVTFDNIPAPLFFASGGQINAQVPSGISAGPAAVQVTSGGASSSLTASVAAFSPGIFTVNQSGSGQGAVLIANTASVAAPAGMLSGSQPAQPGEFVSLYCTGLGAVSNPPAAGAPAAADALSLTLTAPTVTIGSVPAPVQFSGLTPGLVGLYQVNVQVPAGVPTGNAVPVVLSIGGVASNTVTMAIQ